MKSYKEIDDLIIKYKGGEDACINELVKSFEGYLKKFFNFIKYGKADTNDSDIQSITSLLCNKPNVSYNILRGNIGANERDQIRSIQNYIATVCSSIPREDLTQDLQLILLTRINRFTPGKGVNFLGYLTSCIKYDICNYINKSSKDPMAFYIPYALTNEYIDADMVPDPEEVFYSEFDDNWVDGLTCNNLFKEITSFQRQIIKLYYDEKFSDEKIAKMLNSNKSYIYRQRIRAVEVLKERYNENYDL